MMRPHDILIICKIIVNDRPDWKQTQLADDLFMSQSEISASLRRSDQARLLNKAEKVLYPQNIQDFLFYGFPYVFPAKLGPVQKGIKTSQSHPFFSAEFSPMLIPFVWPYLGEKDLGQTITPLHPRQAEAALKDKKLYQLLACLDVIRVGAAREKKMARENIASSITAYEQRVSSLYQYH